MVSQALNKPETRRQTTWGLVHSYFHMDYISTQKMCVGKSKKNIDDHVASFIDPRAGYQFFIKVESLQKVHKNCALGTEISCDFLRKRQTNMPGRM